MSKSASIITAVLLCTGSAAASAQDQVLASFERMFAHQPTHAAPAATIARERDVLLDMVVNALGDQWSPYASSAHPVARAKSPAPRAGDATVHLTRG